MELPKDGFDYLTELRARTEKARRDFNTLEYYLEVKAREKGAPIRGQFELTPLCNLDCRMCYAHLTREQLHDRPIMTVQQWKDLMHEAWEMGMYNVTLTGGESLAYPGFEELYLYLLELGCKITVMTNGILLDERRIRFFTEHRPVLLKVTLYGNSDDAYERVTGHREFRRVYDNIRRIIDARLPLAITVTPSRFLGEDVLDTIRLAKGLWTDVRVANTLFNPREETGRAGQDYSASTETYLRIYQLLDRLENIEIRPVDEESLPAPGGDQPVKETAERGLLCGAGRSSFVVDWKGTMRPCNRMQHITSDPLQTGFRAAWESINRVVNDWPRVAACETCAYAPVCTRCAADMLSYAEPGKRPAGMCDRVRYYVGKGVWRLPEGE